MKIKLSPLEVADCMQLGTVATSLLKLRNNQSLSSIITTSCNPGEGKTSIAIQLARAASSEAQLKVLLIDFNPTSPILSSLFNLSSTPGFTDYLDEKATAEQIIKPATFGDVDIVPYGNTEGGLLGRYDPHKLKEKIAALRDIDGRVYDLTVLDGPSSLSEPDLALTGSAFDGIVLIIECERTRWEVVRYYQKHLIDGKARLIGTVLNKRKYYIPQELYI